MKTEGGFLITQIKQVGGRIFEQILKESGIDEFNGAQGRILYILWEHGAVSLTEIGKMTSLAKTTLTSMIDRMEEKGLVKREQHPSDRRVILIHLTPAAKKLQDDYNSLSDRINEFYYKGFSEEEVAAFEDKLRHILGNLNEYEDSMRRKK